MDTMTETQATEVAHPRGGRYFLRRAAVFTAPFLLFALVVFIVDPFNFFGVSPVVPVDVKKPISNLHYVLWKMPEYRRAPLPNILLGDSRMGSVRADFVEKVSGQQYYNFAYGGASLEEIINTFWFADSLVQLSNVYIGINFNLYNALDRGDRTQDYKQIAQNPFLYFVNPTVVQATWYDIISTLGAKVSIGVPQMSPEVFWNHQLQVTAARMYRRYEYPADYRMALSEIARHCREKRIKLVFVVFPTHTDLQKRVEDFRLEKQQQQFLVDLAELASTVDYDFPNEFTRNRNNFKDPFHFREEVMRFVVEDLWGTNSTIPSKRLGLAASSTPAGSSALHQVETTSARTRPY